MARLKRNSDESAGRLRQIDTAIERLETESRRLAEAIFQGEPPAAIVAALHDNQRAVSKQLDERARLTAIAKSALVADEVIEARLDAALASWRDTLRSHVPEARQVLKALLRDRLVFRPDVDAAGEAFYVFEGQGNALPAITGKVVELPQGLASQGAPSWNHVINFVREMPTLQQAGIR